MEKVCTCIGYDGQNSRCMIHGPVGRVKLLDWLGDTAKRSVKVTTERDGTVTILVSIGSGNTLTTWRATGPTLDAAIQAAMEREAGR